MLTDSAALKIMEVLSRERAVHTVMMIELDEWFVERYGCTYSDCDCDSLIDVIELGGTAPTTIKQIDEEMAFAKGLGFKPQEKTND